MAGEYELARSPVDVLEGVAGSVTTLGEVLVRGGDPTCAVVMEGHPHLRLGGVVRDARQLVRVLGHDLANGVDVRGVLVSAVGLLGHVVEVILDRVKRRAVVVVVLRHGHGLGPVVVLGAADVPTGQREAELASLRHATPQVLLGPEPRLARGGVGIGDGTARALRTVLLLVDHACVESVAVPLCRDGHHDVVHVLVVRHATERTLCLLDGVVVDTCGPVLDLAERGGRAVLRRRLGERGLPTGLGGHRGGACLATRVRGGAGGQREVERAGGLAPVVDGLRHLEGRLLGGVAIGDRQRVGAILALPVRDRRAQRVGREVPHDRHGRELVRGVVRHAGDVTVDLVDGVSVGTCPLELDLAELHGRRVGRGGRFVAAQRLGHRGGSRGPVGVGGGAGRQREVEALCGAPVINALGDLERLLGRRELVRESDANRSDLLVALRHLERAGPVIGNRHGHGLRRVERDAVDGARLGHGVGELLGADAVLVGIDAVEVGKLVVNSPEVHGGGIATGRPDRHGRVLRQRGLARIARHGKGVLVTSLEVAAVHGLGALEVDESGSVVGVLEVVGAHCVVGLGDDGALAVVVEDDGNMALLRIVLHAGVGSCLLDHGVPLGGLDVVAACVPLEVGTGIGQPLEGVAAVSCVGRNPEGRLALLDVPLVELEDELALLERAILERLGTREDDASPGVVRVGERNRGFEVPQLARGHDQRAVVVRRVLDRHRNRVFMLIVGHAAKLVLIVGNDLADGVVERGLLVDPVPVPIEVGKPIGDGRRVEGDRASRVVGARGDDVALGVLELEGEDVRIGEVAPVELLRYAGELEHAGGIVAVGYREGVLRVLVLDRRTQRVGRLVLGDGHRHRMPGGIIRDVVLLARDLLDVVGIGAGLVERDFAKGSRLVRGRCRRRELAIERRAGQRRTIHGHELEVELVLRAPLAVLDAVDLGRLNLRTGFLEGVGDDEAALAIVVRDRCRKGVAGVFGLGDRHGRRVRGRVVGDAIGMVVALGDGVHIGARLLEGHLAELGGILALGRRRGRIG